MKFSNRHALSTRWVFAGVLVGCCLLFVAGTGFAKTPDKSTQPDSTKVVEQIASQLVDELLEGLNKRSPKKGKWEEVLETSLWKIDKWMSKDKKKPQKQQRKKFRKVALWPFWREEVRVSADFSRNFSDDVLAQLIKRSIPYNKFVAREELNKLTKEIDDFNALKKSAKRINQLIRNAGADVLIMAQINQVNEKEIRVSYKAIEVKTGVIVSQTSAQRVPYDAARAKAMTLDSAMIVGARYFTKTLGDMRTLRVKTMHYQDTGIQTPFAKWFLRRFVNEVRKSLQDGSQTLVIADAVVSEEKMNTRGLSIAEHTPEAMMANKASGDYVVKGEYWDLGTSSDFHITMINGAGKKTSWQATVHKTSIPKHLPFKPSGDFHDDRKGDGIGPISLHISSTRGSNPVYRLGQKMVMYIEASQDSYLYCFYRQADGKVMRIFPNYLHKSARVKGGKPQPIPSRAMKFDWFVSPPVGVELVKCYAFDRNVWRHFPRSIRNKSFKPLPYRSLDAITRKLRQIRGVGIAENSMVVNVEQ